MNRESELAGLMQRAASRTLPPSADLVDESINQGRVRQRRRSQRRRLGAVGLVCAVFVTGIVGVNKIDDREPEPAQRPRIHGFGVTPGQMSAVLVTLLPTGSAARRDIDLPVQLAEVLTSLSFPDPSGGAVSRSGVAILDQALVGVVVRRDSTDTTRVESACDNQGRAVVTTCVRTDDGVLLLQVPGQAGVATYLAGEGWIVQAVTDDLGVVSIEDLAAVVQDARWLR